MKLYDDMDELYLSKNQRILAVLQTAQTLVLCYWVFVAASTRFDILVTIFLSITFLLDWESFTSDAYFFSVMILFQILNIGRLIVHGCSFTLKEFFVSFLLWGLSVPFPEFFCIKFNGFASEAAQLVGLSPSTVVNGVTIITITETELEVSFYKLKIRIASLVYLIACLCFLFYIKSLYNDRTWDQMVSTIIAFNSFFMVYVLCSIFNQVNVLFFHPEIVEIHRAKNNDFERKALL